MCLRLGLVLYIYIATMLGLDIYNPMKRVAVCISYNTPSRDLARIYGRCTRACSARGQRAYIPTKSRRRGVIGDL